MVTKARKPRAAEGRRAATLQELLSELAYVLLPSGMTPKRFGDLVRCEFVKAAADMSRLRNGRINQSRVAAQTGLSRAEVKRTLASDVLSAQASDQAPVERVVNGWLRDRQFGRPGRPKALRVSGPGDSFVRLVRKYGGDVPHRAVLDELRRIGAVSMARGRVRLQRLPDLRRRFDFGFLSPVLPAVVDALKIAQANRRGKKTSSIHRLSLPAVTDLDLAIARERCISSAKSMLEGLKFSLGTQLTRPAKARKQTHVLTVTILVSDDKKLRVFPAR